MYITALIIRKILTQSCLGYWGAIDYVFKLKMIILSLKKW